MATDSRMSLLDRLLRFCLQNRLIVCLFVLVAFSWGVLVAPFDWKLEGLPRDPVPVDALPDVGENQQIVFTEWPGRSPQDIEDQVTYPLTVAMLGLPDVKTVRSSSMFGFSSIYVIFKEHVEFYWSRSPHPGKALAASPPERFPPGVQPVPGARRHRPGPDLLVHARRSRSRGSNPAGGWDLDELRSDSGLAGPIRPDASARRCGRGSQHRRLRAASTRSTSIPTPCGPSGSRLGEVVRSGSAWRTLDVGARSIELNGVEYLIRGLGFIEDLSRTSSGPWSRCERQRAGLRASNVGSGDAGARAAPRCAGQGRRRGGRWCGRRALRREPTARYHRAGQAAKIEEIAPGLPAKDTGRRNCIPGDDRPVLRPHAA